MNISLDYDETYTLDPEFWDLLISACAWQGHNIYIVTFRGKDTPIEREMKIPVYYTDRVPKREFMEAHGIKIDVWIDDLPDLIVHGSNWDDGQLAEWKKSLGN